MSLVEPVGSLSVQKLLLSQESLEFVEGLSHVLLALVEDPVLSGAVELFVFALRDRVPIAGCFEGLRDVGLLPFHGVLRQLM